MDKDIYEKSLLFHIEKRGKIEIVSKTPILDKETLSILYTPGVAEVVRAISKDNKIATTATLKGNTVAVVTDGSAILGLGNLGALSAIPVMEGKSAIFKEFAGIDAFPICLDTQNVDEIVDTVIRIAPVFGAINLEDISAPRCFEIEERLREKLSIPVMHDDQHGTAVVVLAGLINSLKIRGGDKSIRIVINGIGSAGTAISNMLLDYGFNNLILVDSKGIINKDREDLTPNKIKLTLVTNTDNVSGSLVDALINADVFIGVSKGNILSKEMIKKMKKDPIIFALANPTPEIMPDDAISSGAFIVATGRSDFPNQVNNALAYPGIFKGALNSGITQFDQKIFVKVAEALANCVPNPQKDKILPDIFDPNIVPSIVAVFMNKAD